MIRKASILWQGTGKDGKGTLTTTSTVLNNTPYSFVTRFESEDGKAGTNPEELIAAACGGCFAMSLSFLLSNAGYTPEELATEASLRMEYEKEAFRIKSIHFDLKGKVPDISEEKFNALANEAKKSCPVSQALSAITITLHITLVRQ